MRLGPLVIGNFKRPRGAKAERKTKLKDRRPGMSDAHLALVRQCGCVCCSAKPAGQVHHLKDTGASERGMGLTSTDRWGLPMCWACHGEVERIGTRNELAWFLAYCVDARALAETLWRESGDSARMDRLILEHRADVQWRMK